MPATATITQMGGSIITGVIAGTFSGVVGFVLGWRARGGRD